MLLRLQHQGKTVAEISRIMMKSDDSVYQNLRRIGLHANKKPKKIRTKLAPSERKPKRDTVAIVPLKEDTPTYFANPVREELGDRTVFLPESYKESRIYKLIHNK